MSEVGLYSASASMEQFSIKFKTQRKQIFSIMFPEMKIPQSKEHAKLQSRDSRDVRQDGTVIIIINPTRQTKLLGGVYTYTSTTTVLL